MGCRSSASSSSQLLRQPLMGGAVTAAQLEGAWTASSRILLTTEINEGMSYV